MPGIHKTSHNIIDSIQFVSIRRSPVPRRNKTPSINSCLSTYFRFFWFYYFSVSVKFYDFPTKKQTIMFLLYFNCMNTLDFRHNFRNRFLHDLYIAFVFVNWIIVFNEMGQFYCTVTIVLPLPNPDDPKQHEACCPLCKSSFRNFYFKKIRHQLQIKSKEIFQISLFHLPKDNIKTLIFVSCIFSCKLHLFVVFKWFFDPNLCDLLTMFVVIRWSVLMRIAWIWNVALVWELFPFFRERNEHIVRMEDARNSVRVTCVKELCLNTKRPI